jgi:hypothetical protein
MATLATWLDWQRGYIAYLATRLRLRLRLRLHASFTVSHTFFEPPLASLILSQ